MPNLRDLEVIDAVMSKRIKALNGPEGSITKRVVLALVATLRSYHEDATTIEGVADALERLCQEAKSISRELAEEQARSQGP